METSDLVKKINKTLKNIKKRSRSIINNLWINTVSAYNQINLVIFKLRTLQTLALEWTQRVISYNFSILTVWILGFTLTSKLRNSLFAAQKASRL